MALKMSLPRAPRKFKLIFINAFLLFAIKSVLAQNQTDTIIKPLLASLEKKAGPGYIIRKSNVVFPEILKGNEEEMLPYIEKFSSSRRNYLVRMYTKGKNYLPKAATVLKKYNLPPELKILLPLESA